MDNGKALNVGVTVRGPVHSYKIIKILGRGGFGVTYLVETQIRYGNIPVKARFAMKEHFMAKLCNRGSDGCTVVFSDQVTKQVRDSLNSFSKEARRLQSLHIDNPNVIKINEIFTANNTAYYIMEYIEGVDLGNYVAREGALSQAATEAIMLPIIKAVAVLHANRLTHYDIKPANIMLRHTSGGAPEPVLIDFGLSKKYDEQGHATSTVALTAVSTGYSPVEQYASLRDFSPQSDVYALAATILFCLTGKRPPEAIDLRLDDIDRRLAPLCTSAWRKAIHNAMMYSRESRTSDAAQFLSELIYGSVELLAPDMSEYQDAIAVDEEPEIDVYGYGDKGLTSSVNGTLARMNVQETDQDDEQVAELLKDSGGRMPRKETRRSGCLIISIIVPIIVFFLALFLK